MIRALAALCLSLLALTAAPFAKSAETSHGWFGVRIQSLDEAIAGILNLPSTRGALVASVDETGPAAAAGLIRGDVVVKFDGKEIKDYRDLPPIVAASPSGAAVEVVFIRLGQTITKTVTLGRLEDRQKPLAQPTAPLKALGMTLTSLGDEERKTYSLKTGLNGVLIAGVEPGSDAAEKNLKPGDVIEEFDLQPVYNLSDIAKEINLLVIQGRRTATLLIGGGAGEPRSARLTRLADADAVPPAVKAQGMSFVALTDLARLAYRFDASADGVEVTAVDAKAPAAKGVRLGDVIKEINLQPARNPAEAVARLRR